MDDIYSYIPRFLRNGSLRSYSLVSRACQYPAQRTLFKSMCVYFYDPTTERNTMKYHPKKGAGVVNWNAYLTFLRENGRIASYVERLHMMGPYIDDDLLTVEHPEVNRSIDQSDLLDILRSLPNLAHLHLDNVVFNMDSPLFPIHPKLNLQTLKIRIPWTQGYDSPGSNDVLDLLQLFGDVGDLQLDCRVDDQDKVDGLGLHMVPGLHVGRRLMVTDLVDMAAVLRALVASHALDHLQSLVFLWFQPQEQPLETEQQMMRMLEALFASVAPSLESFQCDVEGVLNQPIHGDDQWVPNHGLLGLFQVIVSQPWFNLQTLIIDSWVWGLSGNNPEPDSVKYWSWVTKLLGRIQCPFLNTVTFGIILRHCHPLEYEEYILWDLSGLQEVLLGFPILQTIKLKDDLWETDGAKQILWHSLPRLRDRLDLNKYDDPFYKRNYVSS